MPSYKKFLHIGMALDPIHVGTGGARIGRVDLTIVRDPITRVPKIPGSSLAGVYRTYVAMAETEAKSDRKIDNKNWPYYPHCAGLGLARNSYLGHCGQPDCPVCTVFGFARGKDQTGGFAGLAAFSDAHVLLFPVSTYRGPYWITCPMALQFLGLELSNIRDNTAYLIEKSNQSSDHLIEKSNQSSQLNFGWLFLPTKTFDDERQENQNVQKKLKELSIPDSIKGRIAILPDHLFIHVVNSNLEVRTSVSINPETGTAEEKALFSYEALPRTTVLVWEIIAKNPRHFKINGKDVDVTLNQDRKMVSPDEVLEITKKAHPYLEHLGIGGMGTRGMGRVKVLHSKDADSDQKTYQETKQIEGIEE
ncbi:type III-B CRISPR module RAMP protein Cmr4 [Pseudothermotoga sp.]|uniref:type III-B CRISPR module RAMP protein Cmr4 n=1 Tax=Pseudothermotoga sp. TaxID=2033661 RepID=UPI0031F69F85